MNMNLKIIILALISLCLTSVGSAEMISDHFSSAVTQIPDDMGNDLENVIKIKGKYITWDANYNAGDDGRSNYDIIKYDMQSHAKVNVTNNNFEQEYPVVGDNYIVWRDWRHDRDIENDNDLKDIYAFKIDDNTQIRLTNRSGEFDSPLISGSIVMWSISDYATRRDKFLWKDLDTGVTDNFQLTSFYDEYDFDGQTIAWTEPKNYREDEKGFPLNDHNIVIKPLNGNSTSIVNTNTEKLSMKIYGNYIAWKERINAETKLDGLHVRKLNDPINFSNIVNESYLDVCEIFSINDKQILYSARFVGIENTSCNLWLYHLNFGYNYQLTKYEDISTADMDGNTIVWASYNFKDNVPETQISDLSVDKINYSIFNNNHQPPHNPSLPYGFTGQIKFYDSNTFASNTTVFLIDSTSNRILNSTQTDLNGNYLMNVPYPVGTFKILAINPATHYYYFVTKTINYDFKNVDLRIFKNLFPNVILSASQTIPIIQDIKNSVVVNACSSADPDQGPYPLNYVWKEANNMMANNACQIMIPGPGAGQVGLKSYSLNVSDGLDNSIKTFSINWVKGANTAPIFNPIDNQQITAGQTVKFNIVAADAEDIPTLTLINPAIVPGYTLTKIMEGQFSGSYAKVYEFQWTPTNAHAGQRQITLSITDNMVTVNKTININIVADNILPTVNILNPTSSPDYTSSASTISIGAIAGDNIFLKKVQWKVNNSAYADAILVPGFGWMVSNIPLQFGNNTITMRAEDRAGNFGTDTLTVRYFVDTTRPTIIISSPTLSTTLSRIDVQAWANDDSVAYGMSLKSVKWQVNGGAFTDAYLLVTYQANIPLNIGQNIIVFRAEDMAGNVGQASITVTRR